MDFIVHLIQNFGPTAIRVFIGFVNGIIGLLESAFRGILTFVQNILNTIIRSINDALNSLPDFVKDTVFNVTGGRIDIKKGVGLLQEIDVAGSFELPRVGLPAGIGGAWRCAGRSAGIRVAAIFGRRRRQYLHHCGNEHSHRGRAIWHRDRH